MIKFTILKSSREVMPYLNEIKVSTDSNRTSLGFNPLGVYEDSIKKEKLWVAIDSEKKYLGHIMHGGNPPQEIRIFQIYIKEGCRGAGIASSFIKEITLHGENLFCLNLRADVANDLKDAVKFWQSQGFCALAPRRKKNLSGREVLIFYKRLSTPSLIPNEALPLSITAKPMTNVVDSYVIDLNIFLTLIKKQTDESLVAEIMQAAIGGEFSLFVTPEFQEELARTKKDNDPIFDLAEKALPVLDKGDEAELKRLEDEIRTIVFPDRKKDRKDAVNDRSDLRHLAYCIQNLKVGFITQEKAIIRARDALYKKYSLMIYALQDFKLEHCMVDSALSNLSLSNQDGSVQICDVKSAAQMRPFLDSLGSDLVSMTQIALKSAARGMHEKKVVLLGDDTYAVYIAQTKGAKHDVLEGFFVSTGEQLISRDAVFQHMLECFMRLSQRVKAKTITFYVRQEDFDLEKICMGRGFERTNSIISGMIALTKIPSSSLITKANWREFRKEFLNNTNIDLPQFIPSVKMSSSGTSIIQATKAGRSYDAELFKLETVLSPSLVMLPKRTGVIISIAPAYAEKLLSRSEGLLPFALPEEALLRVEKVYFRKPSHTKMLSAGTPITFYESGPKGRGVIGCARIVSVEVTTFDNALKLYRRHGVLDAKELVGQVDKNGNVQIIIFDNFKVFERPVTLKRLRELGCAKADMVSPEKLSYDQLFSIVHEGMNIPTKDVIISIQPDFNAKILSGKKTIELRKKPFPVNDGVRIWIYSTSPVSAIESTAFVTSVDTDTPENIWKKYSDKCGISKKDFDAYFAGSTEAYALHIRDARSLEKKIKLEEIKKLSEGFVAPQYYRYVEHESNLFDALIVR